MHVTNLLVKKPRYVRVNTLHYTPDEIIKIFRNEGWSFIPASTDYSAFLETISNLDDYSFTKDFHIKELLVFSGTVQFYENELYQNGSILLQDKASCLPAFLLKPAPDSVTLDMCAAPGMKTTHLSALMKNKGQIYASEIDPNRYKVLCDVVRNAGCKNVTPINIDALKLEENNDTQDLSWTKDVEYILVDPSCSGSGIVERVKIFTNEKNDPRRLKKLCGFQFKLLKHALTNFPKAKRVVYSTCSVQPQENEKVVEDVLTKLNNPEEGEKENLHPKFRLIEPLKESWLRRGKDEFEHGRFCIFSDPDKDLTNGFFIAVFERVEEEKTVEDDTKVNKKKKDKDRSKGEEDGIIENSKKDELTNVEVRKKKNDKKRNKEKIESVTENKKKDMVEARKKEKKRSREEEDDLTVECNEIEINKKNKKKRKKEEQHSEESTVGNNNTEGKGRSYIKKKKKKHKQSSKTEEKNPSED